MTAAVTFQRVSRHYGSVRAVDEVDLDIAVQRFFQKLSEFGHGFARHDHVGHRFGTGRAGEGVARQPVAVGRHAAQAGAARLLARRGPGANRCRSPIGRVAA